MELIDQDYVLVLGPPVDVSSTSASASKPSHSSYKSESLPQESLTTSTSAPMPIIGAASNNTCVIGSLDSQSSAPGTSLGSTDMADALEQPSSHCMTRLNSLQQCVSAITELVHEKVNHVFLPVH